IRLAGEHGLDAAFVKHLTDSVRTTTPDVRLQIASTLIRSGRSADTLPLLHALLEREEDAADPVIPLMLWLAYDPYLAAAPAAELDWLRDNAPGNALLTSAIVPRAMRRLVATGKPEDLAACVEFLRVRFGQTVKRAALEGLT